jgi:hypothetical protein
LGDAPAALRGNASKDDDSRVSKIEQTARVPMPDSAAGLGLSKVSASVPSERVKDGPMTWVWRTVGSTGLTVLCLVGLSANALAQGSFDFALDAMRVDGNLNASGTPNGVRDFLNDFNDASLVTLPTSAFHCLQPVSESGSFLRLRTADGFNTFSPGFRVDNCLLGGEPGPSAWRLINGAAPSKRKRQHRQLVAGEHARYSRFEQRQQLLG